MNAGMIVGMVLLLIGAALMLAGDGKEFAGIPLQNFGMGVLLLATTVYLGGRIAMFVGRPRP